MMKLVGIVGSIADQSYNKELMKFVASRFSNLVDIEILDISDVPLFDRDHDQSESATLQYLNAKIQAADGVIIATPEHNHTIPAALKNVIEWLSYNLHPFNDKPVMIIGASYHDQGSSRAQLNLRQILESPGVNAITMPGNEFLLGNVKTAFDAQGNLKDERTVDFLRSTLQKFLKFVEVINKLNGHEDYPGSDEDLYATGRVKTTVPDVDMNDPEWVEKAAEKTNAATGDDYVKLDRGLLTVEQINMFLNTMPMELTYADENNQFIYYNDMGTKPEDMLASRRPDQVGSPLAAVHPPRALKGVQRAVNMLRSGKTDLFILPVPGNGPEKHLMHYYKRMEDAEGNYRGINEWVLDLWPIVKYYLESTGQKLVPDPTAAPVAVTGASQTSTPTSAPTKTPVDETSGASDSSEPEVTPVVDSNTSASETEEIVVVDETSGASES